MIEARAAWLSEGARARGREGEREVVRLVRVGDAAHSLARLAILYNMQAMQKRFTQACPRPQTGVSVTIPVVLPCVLLHAFILRPPVCLDA